MRLLLIYLSLVPKLRLGMQSPELCSEYGESERSVTFEHCAK
jgi:hypothetical protein